ncbi:protein of unknown function [Streptomyces sp. KY75]|nr:protein of unknown function [Streptomyces sp. KY70]CAD5989356.1 protein of unknown function [Streptomyces sp. KY75]
MPGVWFRAFTRMPGTGAYCAGVRPARTRARL